MKTEPASPGAALSGRVRTEAQITALVARHVRAFLLAVEKEAAREAAAGDVSGIALAPLREERVAQLWEELVVDPLLAEAVDVNHALTAAGWSPTNLVPIVGDLTRAAYLTAMRDRLRASELPGESYLAAKKVLTRGRAEGWSQRKTVAALSRALDKDRPEDAGASFDAMLRRIARTEATTIFNYSTLTLAANRGATTKTWIAHHDNRTRDSHLAADGQKTPLDEPFIVGGSRLMVPGDPDAPTAETANCRCIMVAE